MVKQNKKKKLKVQKKRTRLFDNFFLALLLFILVLEFFLLSPTTSSLVEKVPMLYLSVFYVCVFLFPFWILISYYFNTILKNETPSATKLLVSALIRGLVYFILFIIILAFIVLETREIAVILLSKIFVQIAVLLGLAIVIFSFLLKLYLCKIKPLEDKKWKQ